MERFMKVALITAPDRIAIREVSDPSPKPWEALVKIDACAICNGTDSKILHGQFPGMSTYPVLPGHESTGLVVEVGSMVRRYKVGDRVLRPAADPPGIISMWGGFAEYGLAGDPDAFREAHPDAPLDWRWSMQQVVPPDIPADEATILITVKETYSWLKRFGVESGSRVLILGAGPVSLIYACWARYFGCELVAIAARRADARERAKRFGADQVIDLSAEDLGSQAVEITSGRGFDRLVDAVGSSGLLMRSMQMLATGGRVGVYGVGDATPEGLGQICVPRGGEFTLMVFNPDEAGVHDEVTTLVSEGKIRPSDFISHRLSLEQIATGFELVADRQAVKVVVQP